MERVQTVVNWVLFVTLSSHVFCCVLPTALSLVSALSGLGLLSASLPVVHFVHEVMHDFEHILLSFSGFMLAVGWAAYVYAKRIDCHDTGGHHGPCEPKKDRSKLILQVASALFAFNAFVLVFMSH